jgi:alpha-L-fucosidase 2
MWEHYLFTKDLDFLKNTAYTFLHEASVFFLENLERDVKGRLVYAPSTSPENPYYAEEDGKRVSCYLASGTTMDRQIISALLEMYLKASELLGIEEEDTKTARKTLEDLPPMQVGKHGQLMEWIEDYDEVHVGHRHTSHAFGLYPAAQITRATPELYNAMKVTLTRRLSGHDNSFAGAIGWANTWRSAMFSRLRDSASAYNMLNQFVSKTLRYNLWEVVDIASMGGNVFQIDGNLAYIASLAEMLLQSHEDVIAILPALPAQWDHGAFRGLCARGGFEVNIKWNDGKLESAEILSKCGNVCSIRHSGIKVSCEEHEVEAEITNGVTTFATQAGCVYELTF